MKYRSEIDGLRALAVVPVILFHAGFAAFSGGFVGVDVFFVISGYLITGLILEDIAKGTFSIARFYERRARRILPALFFVMLCCVPVAFLLMLPSQYLSFGQSLMAVVLFVSNIFFWRESGYFAAEASEKPLLHTWSLGVEEQYYVLFPLLLLLLWRFGKRSSFWAILLLAALSLAACEYASRYHSSANFFLLPTRAWELFVGSLCAFAHREATMKQNNLLATLGLACIGISIVMFSEHMRLPSALMLMPVLGTALILLYGTGGTHVARALSLRPIVGIGLISYSAYLWHQPIFAFARIRSFTTLSDAMMLLLAAVALALAAFSWRFIEQPFRKKQHPHYVQNRTALRLACGIAILFLAIGAIGHITHGHLDFWKTRAAPEQLRAFELIDQERSRDFAYDNGDCVFNMNQLTDALEERIIACSKKYGPGIASIGDSHAMNQFHLLKASAGDTPFLIGFGQGMCRPYGALVTCNYVPLRSLLERQPNLFDHIIYEQAGWELLTDHHGKDIEQDMLSGLPLDAPVPDFGINEKHIDTVITYLSTLTPYARIIWLGPRIEPEISESILVHLGCSHSYHLRPNQAEQFERLDDAIRGKLEGTSIHFHSQIEALGFNMDQDFMDCDTTYWKDRNHYSAEGEKRFGARMPLSSIIGTP